MIGDLTRREFLLLNLTAGVVALSGAPFAHKLSEDDHRTLLAVARTLFPHEGATDEHYVRAINRLDALCTSDDAALGAVARGLQSLEWACNGHFESVSRKRRVSLLRAIEGSRGFQIMYAELLHGLYGTPEMWQLFGSAA